MEYKMEELLPVVAKLAEKYTGFESTSLTYEKAEQLMEAVLYCIREEDVEQQDIVEAVDCIPVQRSVIRTTGRISAQQAYETGYANVVKKVKLTLKVYHEILPYFNSYGNHCLYDTFIRGMPEFFKWYDARFEPQREILTLDYPVGKDLTGLCGIDRVYEYVRCIGREQAFLRKLPENDVKRILRDYHREYEDLIENMYEIVAAAVIS